jgi:hypothetical protein
VCSSLPGYSLNDGVDRGLSVVSDPPKDALLGVYSTDGVDRGSGSQAPRIARSSRSFTGPSFLRLLEFGAIAIRGLCRLPCPCSGKYKCMCPSLIPGMCLPFVLGINISISIMVAAVRSASIGSFC